MEQKNIKKQQCSPILVRDQKPQTLAKLGECQILKRIIEFLQARCQHLQTQNQRLKCEAKQRNKVVIKIDIFEKNGPIKGAAELVQETKYIKYMEKYPKRRRKLADLVKNFNCPYPNCFKEYASSLALNLHMRVKHGGGTKKQRKSLLKNIIDAQIQGKELPEIKLNLPPNYLEVMLTCTQEKRDLILQSDTFYRKPPSPDRE